MDLLINHSSQVRVPSDNQEIYKDECVYSYDTPETVTGLYVSLTSFLGFGEEYVQGYAKKTGNFVFLHIRREKLEKKKEGGKNASGMNDDSNNGPVRKITRLAIGLEGGYNDKDTENYEIKETLSIVVMPNIGVKITYPNADLPNIVIKSVEKVLAQESATKKLEKDLLTGTWDGELRRVSKYSDLKQLDNGKRIPPSGWQCEKCELKSNLWLNLTDGSILCGRKFFDGSGGNGHAAEHYKEFAFPLAVKLGTITYDGKADVFSYPEDDMVIDSNLEKHLAHFGINMSTMKKSEKSMVELELEINQRIGEWSLLTECDSELKPLSGPGYTGMRNLGNSCYISSVMQVLFTIPDFIKRFVGTGADQYLNEYPNDPVNNFNIQLSKLGNGLWSGKYSSSIMENSLDNPGISPGMFKNLVSKNHPSFSTKQQQDALDFYLHFINVLERHSHNQFNPADALRFAIEERVECMTSKKVKYTRRDEFCLPLQIPMDKAINLDEVVEYMAKKGKSNDNSDVIRHKIPLLACLEGFFASEQIEDFYSTAIKSLTTAKKISRLVNMPDYLMLHLRKFKLGEDWLPIKLDVAIQMPEYIDLSNWRASGKQPNEEELMDNDDGGGEKTSVAAFVIDENLVNSLMQMGFPQDACRRAVFNTRNGGLELASNWLMEHIDDADFSEPFVMPPPPPPRSTTTNNTGMDVDGNESSKSTSSSFVPNPESLATLTVMGFDERQAIRALKATNGNLERATDWIFSHADELNADDDEMDTGTAGNRKPSKEYRDGGGKYKLVAFISHMGSSAHVGHYVCHIQKNDDQWVIYNDSKVALSQKPPKDLGYLYMYKRID